MPQQWQPAVAPFYRRRADVKIVVNGKDVTDPMEPHLISVQVILKDFGPDMANIELDDRDGILPIPRYASTVVISMGWAGSGPSLPLSQHVERLYKLIIPDKYIDGSPIKELPFQASGMQVVFRGQVTSVESGFSRSGGGRRLWIECKSALDGDHKSPSLSSIGEGDPDGESGQDVSLTDFLSQVAGNHGLSFNDGGLGGDIKRKFWLQDNESFSQLGQRLASELGFGFKIVGNTAFLTSRESIGTGPTVEAVWGTNLISWRIKPFSSRPQWSASKQRFFDIWQGLWKTTSKDMSGGLPFGLTEATSSLPSPAPNSQAGQQFNDGMISDSEEGRGTGWVIINGEPAAQPNGACVITGARPGVDGRYKISEAEHNYTRGGGYTSRCQLKRPELINDDYAAWNNITNDQIKDLLDKLPTDL